jgi:hypothetical protein
VDPKIPYLAGLIDGEGCFCFQRTNGVCRPLLVIHMTDLLVIKWLKAKFGGSLTITKPVVAENKEGAYTWVLAKRSELKLLLPELLDFLITKKMHAMLVLDFCNKFRLARGSEDPYTPQEKELMQKYAELLRAMNSKGIGSNVIKDELRLSIVRTP